MNIKTVMSLYKKEFIDIIRDKKTIIMMIVLPIILYPLLMFAGLKIGSMISENEKSHEYKISMTLDNSAFNIGKNQINDKRNSLKDFISDNDDYKLYCIDSKDCSEDLRNNYIDAYISEEKNEDGTVSYVINYNSSETNSLNAMNALDKVLKDYNTSLSKKIVQGYGLDAEKSLNPIEITSKNFSSSEKSIGSILGLIVPLLLIVSILMGSIYPAIDVTAGEKERGTLETVLTLPVTNKELIFSKFLAVSTIAVISALANLLSMSIVGTYIYSTMKSMLQNVEAISAASFIPSIIVVFLCVITFALFVTALSMSVCIFAKTFKEAQNYITPFMIVLMLLSYVSIMPNVSPTDATAAIPVVNLSLLIKDVLVFKFNISAILIVLVSNIIYSFITVSFLSKIYNSENILFGSGKIEFKIFERRANLKRGEVPSFSDAVLISCIGMLLIVYIGSYFQIKFGLFGILSNQIILIVIAVLYIIYTKCDIKKTLNVGKPDLLSIVYSVLLWIGTFILTNVISIPLQSIMSDSSENLYMVNVLFNGHGLFAVIFVVSIAPAICEELFFRGFVFSALKEKFNIKYAVVIVSLIFAVYHMSLVKFIPIFILAVSLCISVYYSKSIVNSMCMHFLNNFSAVIFIFYGDQISNTFSYFFGELSVLKIIIYLCFSIIFIVLGIILLKRRSMRSFCYDEPKENKR